MACSTGYYSNVPSVNEMAASLGYPGYGPSAKLNTILGRHDAPMTPVDAFYPGMSTFEGRFNSYPSWWNSQVAPSTWWPSTMTGYPMPSPFDAPIMPSTFDRLPSSWWTAGYPTTSSSFPAPWTAGYPTNWSPASWTGVPSYFDRFHSSPSSWWMNNNNNSSRFGLPSPISENNMWSSCSYRPVNPIEAYCLTNPVRILDREGNRMIWLCYELKGFKPEEVSVTLNKAERSIVCEATHDVKEGKEHHVTRKFYRKFVLPESIKCDLSKCELKSCLSTEGMLTIECSLPKMTSEEIAHCPTMRKVVEMPYYFNFNNTIGSCPSTNLVGRPVTVKTA